MGVLTLGLNHTTAPLDVRGRFAFAPHQLQEPLRELTQRLSRATPEAALLSTCNRTELYLAADAQEAAALVQPATEWLAAQGGVSASQLGGWTYAAENRAAARHAFRVAAGLDSMVLGEPQILGQMKQAVRHAESAGSLGLVLNRLFQRTFAVAKDVRTQTDIGSASISMAAAAVKLAERIFPALADQRLLFIGAGEMIDLTATHFAARNPRSITIANRTLERGRELAARFEREARITARLQHPAIVQIHEAGTWPNGEPFYAMKLVEGRSLDDAITRTKTLEERLALVANVVTVAGVALAIEACVSAR